MIPTFRSLAIAALVLIVLDLIWVGWLMAPFYQSRLRPVLNLVDGRLEPRLIPVILTYITMVLLVACFAVPLARTYAAGSALGVFGIGAFLGLIVYGLYNFTNLSLLKEWSTAVAIVDTLWGGVIFGVATLAVWFWA